MSIAGQGDPTPFEEWHGEVGCLLLHGFPGSPAEVRELGAYLGLQGVSVVAPVLPGHGQRPEALQGVGWEDWLQAAAGTLRYLQERCTWVFACGLSFGAALSLYLAAEVPLAGVAAISPAVALRSPFARLLPVARYFIRWFDLAEDADLADPAASQRQWYYTRVPVAAMAEMYRGLRLAWRVAPRVRVPVLVIQSRQDGVLRPEGAMALLQRLGSQEKRLVWLERSGHNAFVDAERDKVFSEVFTLISHVQQSAVRDRH